MTLNFLSECKEKVLKRIDGLLPETNKVISSMRYSSLAHSKCIRAGLIFASGELRKDIPKSALTDMATSIELMHTYSLIHDDLPSMDDDEIRRGQASNHIKFNEATAILAGDALQALAYEVLVTSKEMTDQQKVACITALTDACGHKGMILGQQYDLDAEKNEFADIEKIHELKTARLIQVAITLPHMGLKNQRSSLALLDEIGLKLGLAFQIMDDVLEASSDSNTLGKSNQSDIKNKKLTYVNVFGMQESIEKADVLSNQCIAKLKNSFGEEKIKSLVELANFMVTRNN